MSFRIHRWHHHRKMLAGALAMLFSLALAVSAPLTSFAAGWLTDTGSDWKSSSSYIMSSPVWTAAGTLPSVVANSNIAVSGGFAYLVGGQTQTGEINGVLYRASTATPTTWTSIGNFPIFLYNSSLAIIGTNMYLFGGRNATAYGRYIYSTPVGSPTSWAPSSAQLPAAVGNSHVAVIGSNVYLFGGYNGTTAMSAIYRAPTSDPTSWTTMAGTLPVGVYSGQLAVIGTDIYLFGGFTASGTATNKIFKSTTADPTTWVDTLATLPVALAGSQVLVTQNAIYLLGGNTGATTTNAIYGASISNPTSWSQVGTLPANLSHSQVAIINGVAYLFGGFTTNAANSGTTLILQASLTTDTTPPIPNPLTFATAPTTTAQTNMTMTATTATDADGATPVEYFFSAAACATDAGTGFTSSGWQTLTDYTDTGLQRNKCYSYAVRARDSLGNIGSPSATSSSYTRAAPPGAPSLALVSDHMAQVINDENTNPSNTTFALQVSATTPTDSTWRLKYLDAAGNPSATAVWLSDATWDTVIMKNLLGGTTYSVRARARNGDGVMTNFSATTDVTGATTPAPPMTGTPLTGYGWSDTAGWISLNCSNTDTCSTSNYGTYIQSDGTVTGYAWSDSVGWIQFGGLSSFPTGGGTTAANATLIGSTALTGWARACAGTVGGDCSSMTSRTDGWDGWIALSGTSYGPALSSGSLTGYSWGDTNVGWILWNAATTYQPCQTTSGYQCVGNDSVYTAPSCTQTTDVCSSHGTGWFCSSDNHLCTAPPAPSYTNASGELTARPSLVKSGATTKLSWSVADANTCTISGNGDSWSGITSSAANCATKTGTMCVTAPITDLTTYTLHCVGDGGTLDGSATITLIPSWRER